MTKLIIDLDSMIYKAGFSVEKKIRQVRIKGEDNYRASFQYIKDMKHWLEENGLSKNDVEINERLDVAPLDHAKHILNLLMESITSKYRTKDIVMFMGGKSDFRLNIYPDYKANRENAAKPVHYNDLFHWLLFKGAQVPQGIEADDAVCIEAWKCLNKGEDFVIARIDKDLAQIPGTHYNYTTGEEITIDPWTADFNFYTQLLVGDVSDHIPGAKGIGEKTAPKLLGGCNDERDMYRVCCDVWGEQYGPTKLNQSAQCLYLLRHIDDKWRAPI